MYQKEIMNLAIKKACETMKAGVGGPFGAAITKGNETICIVSNSVLADNDPTAHAEMNAIREASKKLGTYDLTGCTLYATGYPCPMCMSAIIWANIKEVYYCNDVISAEKIGFRDEPIYSYIKDGCKNSDIMKIEHKPSDAGKDLYCDYKNLNKTIY